MQKYQVKIFKRRTDEGKEWFIALGGDEQAWGDTVDEAVEKLKAKISIQKPIKEIIIEV